MTIKNILENNDIFSDATLLAGQKGTDKEVTSVMVLEAADIENWGREGQLLLTSFFALQALDVEKSREFLVKCRDLGISGLAVKMGRLINDIPSFFVDYCNYYAIPLITLPQDIRYEQIIISILEPIITQLNAQQQASQRYNDLASDLLNGQIKDSCDIDRALHYFSLDSYPFYQVMLIQLPFLCESLLEESPRLLRTFRFIRLWLENLGLRFINLRTHDRVTLLFNTPSSVMPVLTRDKLNELLAELEKYCQPDRLDYQISLSDIQDRYHIAELNQQVLNTQQIMNLLKRKNHITYHSELGIYRLFLEKNNLQLLRSLVTEEHFQLRKNYPDLWQTLEIFIATGQSYSETAGRLYLHPKTVKYRINKINQMLPDNLSDPEEVFRIMLDTRLFALLDYFS
ncbi:MAG: PucR family transcriptional regulator [Clostridiales bacterium]|nr:PucR family transcriptional regulator [Clostridiales bacterium]